MCEREGKAVPMFSLHLTEAKANKMPAELKTFNYKTKRKKKSNKRNKKSLQAKLQLQRGGTLKKTKKQQEQSTAFL